MKKIAILSCLALGLAFTACDSYEEPNPAPQSNAQEPILQASGIEITSEIVPETTVDLNDYNATGLDVALAKIDSRGNLAMTYDLAFTAQVAANDAFGKFIELPITVQDNQLYAKPDALSAIFKELISKDPAANTLYVRYAAYATNGAKSRVRIGGPDEYYCPMQMMVKPFAPATTIEDTYYLMGTEKIQFSHSSISPYDDPVFTAVIQVTAEQAQAGGFKWAIAPATTVDAGSGLMYGPADDQTLAAEGTLVQYDANPVYGVIEKAGPYLLTVNMETKAYSYIPAYERLYMSGDAQGWSPATAMQLATTDYKNYQGYAVLSPGGFKVVLGPDWSAGDYGQGDAEGKLGHGDNLTVAEKGLYWVRVNLNELTISCTLITTIGVIGDATPNSWNASTPLTPSEDLLTWSGEIAFNAGGEWKFRANDDWGVNLGGQLGDLVQDGGNLPGPGEGTKKVTLNLSSIPYQATVE